MTRVYYQPIMTDAQWNEHRWFNSFNVYHSYENAKADFPDCEIGAYSGDDIEEPTYIDDVPPINVTEVVTKDGDTVYITSENLTIVVKHNDVGVSIDYYGDLEEEPIRADQVWFEDIAEEE